MKPIPLLPSPFAKLFKYMEVTPLSWDNYSSQISDKMEKKEYWGSVFIFFLASDGGVGGIFVELRNMEGGIDDSDNVIVLIFICLQIQTPLAHNIVGNFQLIFFLCSICILWFFSSTKQKSWFLTT